MLKTTDAIYLMEQFTIARKRGGFHSVALEINSSFGQMNVDEMQQILENALQWAYSLGHFEAEQ